MVYFYNIKLPNMRKLEYTTNISTTRALKLVKPVLDGIEYVSKWEIEVNTKRHMLTVFGDKLCPVAIENAVMGAGFEIEPAHKQLFYATYFATR